MPAIEGGNLAGAGRLYSGAAGGGGCFAAGLFAPVQTEKFTLYQLFASLVLKDFYNLTYRGMATRDLLSNFARQCGLLKPPCRMKYRDDSTA